MKASVTFRDDHKPLARAKVPISILGLPFSSGVAVGDPKELRFDLSTAFDSGPAVRVSYRPNDGLNPFSLVLKTGIGTFGSPIAAPMSMSAEFNLLCRRGPVFFLHLKPRIGDFSVVKTTGSAADSAAAVSGRVVANHSANGGIGNGVYANGFPAEIQYPVSGIDRLLSGVEITARSVLPLKNKAAVKFMWGVRIPVDLKNSFDDQENGLIETKRRNSWISPRDLPLLVMRKISIEQTPKIAAGTKKNKSEDNGATLPQLEVLRVEQGMLRKAVDDLRTELLNWKNVVVGQLPTINSKEKGGDGWSRVTQNGKNSGRTLVAGKEEVNEDLRKALTSATGVSGGN